MTLVPKNPTVVYPPPDGYGFTDPRTQMRFDGLHGNVETTALKIIEHRKANPHVYPEGGSDLGSVIQEVYRQKAATMPHLFLGFPDQDGSVSQIPASLACSCGANDFEPVYCPTCGGQRVSYYKCRACGKQK